MLSEPGHFLVVAAYLLGSVSFGLIIAQRRGIDLRAEGSGNTGATNVGRLLGKKTGRLVLLLDAVKGMPVVGIAILFLGLDHVHTAACGVAAVFGHCYPVWHRFRGGKGAATAVGVMLVLVPFAGVAAALTYVILKKVTRRASVGTLAGAFVAMGTGLYLLGPNPRGLMTIAIFLVVTLRHAGNLYRLVRGEEPPS